jgi:altronate dehydratase
MGAGSAIRLAENDNVGVVTSDVRPGSNLCVGDLQLPVRDPIPFGHKIALVPIASGEKVIKFGVPIGRAKIAIEAGEHVHVHNIESTYINNAVDHYEA